MTNFSKYKVVKNNRNSSFEFFQSKRPPSKYPVTTPFTFPFIGKDVVLCLDKNNWWNPLGGHIETDENYKDTLLRESNEEAGVTISKSSIATLGYILNTNLDDSSSAQYPPLNILPITRSFVTRIDQNWKPRETRARGIFRKKKALELMKERTDNNQMFEILELAYQIFEDQKYQTNFTYYPNKMFKTIPITQVFTFCKDSNGHYCVVKDTDEEFFSLPGGSCELGETPEECISRELDEEAQLSCKDPKLLGSILVELKQGNEVVSRFQHLRYMADLDLLQEFVPNKKGFETSERQFLPLSELKSKVMLLRNPNGEALINQISNSV